MEYLLFILLAYILGFLAAIPAGPIQIEVIRRSISGNLKPSLMVILGASIVDVIYGVIAFFGIAPFLQEERVMAMFWLAGASLLLALGIVIILHSLQNKKFNPNAEHLRRKRWGFIGGITLSGTNPMMILWWLVGARIFHDIGLINELTPRVAFAFLTAGGLGLASYLILLSLFLYWAKRFIPERRMRRINLALGFLLLIAAGYFVVTSLKVIV